MWGATQEEPDGFEDTSKGDGTLLTKGGGEWILELWGAICTLSKLNNGSLSSGESPATFQSIRSTGKQLPMAGIHICLQDPLADCSGVCVPTGGPLEEALPSCISRESASGIFPLHINSQPQSHSSASD